MHFDQLSLILMHFIGLIIVFVLVEDGAQFGVIVDLRALIGIKLDHLFWLFLFALFSLHFRDARRLLFGLHL